MRASSLNKARVHGRLSLRKGEGEGEGLDNGNVSAASSNPSPSSSPLFEGERRGRPHELCTLFDARLLMTQRLWR
jgi:hypothetical protein